MATPCVNAKKYRRNFRRADILIFQNIPKQSNHVAGKRLRAACFTSGIIQTAYLADGKGFRFKGRHGVVRRWRGFVGSAQHRFRHFCVGHKLLLVLLAKRKLDGVGRCLGAEVIHAGFQPFLPSIEVHGRKLRERRRFHKHV